MTNPIETLRKEHSDILDRAIQIAKTDPTGSLLLTRKASDIRNEIELLVELGNA